MVWHFGKAVFNSPQSTQRATAKSLDVFSVSFGEFGGNINERGQGLAGFPDSRLHGNDNHLKLNTANTPMWRDTMNRATKRANMA